MKTLLLCPFVFLFFFISLTPSIAQESPEEQEPPTIQIIIKNDGSRFVGEIISQDAREVLIRTEELGEVYIPRHEIRQIREATAEDLIKPGEFTPAEIFATRYFITTNGLPVEKGETYMLMSLLGPDFQFGVGDNFGMGVLTTWIGTPIIGSMKYSIPISREFSAGVGLLVGTGSWTWPDFALALPYGVVTLGDRIRNINFSFGYGGVTYKVDEYDFHGNQSTNNRRRENEGNFLISVAGMAKLSRNFSFVFDSFIVPRTGTDSEGEERYGIAIFLPGLRFQTNPNSAFQFGFAGIRAEGETIGIPIPVVQWFRKL
ncbi:MAG: hypothetical protein EA393_04400 [Bacteroidetes bacterium]|nr:MAG: hypothetical protein EA393_04400 [Bacteroidota bacterium]